jgi:hypothetical protein
MQPNVNTLERAFELARTGEFDRIGQVKNRLKLEGYSSELVVGSYLSAQLRQLMRMAHPESYGLLSDRRTRNLVGRRGNRRGSAGSQNN